MTGAPVPDLLAVLEEIEMLAKHTQANLRHGLASTGVCGLRKIELAAQDARRLSLAQSETAEPVA